MFETLTNILSDEAIDPTLPVDDQPSVFPLREQKQEAHAHLKVCQARYMKFLNMVDPHRHINLSTAPTELERLQAEIELPLAKRDYGLAEIAFRKASERYEVAVKQAKKTLLDMRAPGRRQLVRELYRLLDLAKVANDAILAYDQHTRALVGTGEFDVFTYTAIQSHWPELIDDPTTQGGLLEHRRRLLHAEGLL